MYYLRTLNPIDFKPGALIRHQYIDYLYHLADQAVGQSLGHFRSFVITLRDQLSRHTFQICGPTT